jgi:glutamate synthase (NADPH/NADH) large chain
MVQLEKLNIEDENIIRMYVENHLEFTNSALAQEILDNWQSTIPHFVKVMPIDFKRALSEKNITLLQKLEGEVEAVVS